MEKFARRHVLITVASLPAWAAGKTMLDGPVAGSLDRTRGSTHNKPMTAREESAAARAMGEFIANETGDPMHPAVGTAPRLHNPARLFNGETFSEMQLKGKLLLVFYWASWCPVCKIVMPRLNDFWLKNQSRGLEVLALSVDAKAQPAFAYIERMGYKFPASMASAVQMSSALAVRALPTLMVRSKLGVIVSVDEGDVDEDDLQSYLVHV